MRNAQYQYFKKPLLTMSNMTIGDRDRWTDIGFENAFKTAQNYKSLCESTEWDRSNRVRIEIAINIGDTKERKNKKENPWQIVVLAIWKYTDDDISEIYTFNEGTIDDYIEKSIKTLKNELVRKALN